MILSLRTHLTHYTQYTQSDWVKTATFYNYNYKGWTLVRKSTGYQIDDTRRMFWVHSTNYTI